MSTVSGVWYRSEEEFLGEYGLSGHGERWPVLLAEEADQPFDVLCRCRQEELLPNELHSPQAQTTQSDLILQFREQRFHLLSLPLCARKGGLISVNRSKNSQRHIPRKLPSRQN